MNIYDLDHIYFRDAIENYNPVLHNFYSTSPSDFSNYTSISQGEVGDCWLLAPMAAISRSPLLRKILQRNFTINADNTYTIILYSNSGAVTINLNGNLFILPQQGEYKSDLLFSGQQQYLPEKSNVKLNSIWFAFIEKAVALLFGGYHLLDGGDPDSPNVKQADLGFHILTNKPVITIMIDNMTDFRDNIKNYLKNGAAIVFTTKTNSEIAYEKAMKNTPSSPSDNSELNLLEDHAYVIDSISRDGSITLFNPHGEFSHLIEQNKASKLTESDARYFGKRLDILPGNISGGTRKIRLRRSLRRKNTNSNK
jgi:hypothetical protein